MRYFMSSQKEKFLIPGNFKLGKAVFTFALLNNQNEIKTQREACYKWNINKHRHLEHISNGLNSF